MPFRGRAGNGPGGRDAADGVVIGTARHEGESPRVPTAEDLRAAAPGSLLALRGAARPAARRPGRRGHRMRGPGSRRWRRGSCPCDGPGVPGSGGAAGGCLHGSPGRRLRTRSGSATPTVRGRCVHPAGRLARYDGGGPRGGPGGRARAPGGAARGGTDLARCRRRPGAPAEPAERRPGCCCGAPVTVRPRGNDGPRSRLPGRPAAAGTDLEPPGGLHGRPVTAPRSIRTGHAGARPPLRLGARVAGRNRMPVGSGRGTADRDGRGGPSRAGHVRAARPRRVHRDPAERRAGGLVGAGAGPGGGAPGAGAVGAGTAVVGTASGPGRAPLDRGRGAAQVGPGGHGLRADRGHFGPAQAQGRPHARHQSRRGGRRAADDSPAGGVRGHAACCAALLAPSADDGATGPGGATRCPGEVTSVAGDATGGACDPTGCATTDACQANRVPEATGARAATDACQATRVCEAPGAGDATTDACPTTLGGGARGAHYGTSRDCHATCACDVTRACDGTGGDRHGTRARNPTARACDDATRAASDVCGNRNGADATWTCSGDPATRAAVAAKVA